MARIWKERNNLPLSKEDRLRSRLNSGLDIGWRYFVEICGFIFQFRKIDEIQEYIDYYSLKVHPSSRKPEAKPGSDYSTGDHWERQTKFDELPLYLREEAKREKVVQALLKAKAMFSHQDGKGTNHDNHNQPGN